MIDGRALIVNDHQKQKKRSLPSLAKEDRSRMSKVTSIHLLLVEKAVSVSSVFWT